MKQETAIEWFVDELQRAGWIPKNSSIMNYVILEAKKIEKKQIAEAQLFLMKDTWWHPIFPDKIHLDKTEKYYNETFKSE